MWHEDMSRLTTHQRREAMAAADNAQAFVEALTAVTGWLGRVWDWLVALGERHANTHLHRGI